MVRGPWVVRDYFESERRARCRRRLVPDRRRRRDRRDGYLQITDRSKDVIKSGGEWISSIELENIASATSA
jgi:fatty-acyl-CoA synthase